MQAPARVLSDTEARNDQVEEVKSSELAARQEPMVLDDVQAAQ